MIPTALVGGAARRAAAQADGRARPRHVMVLTGYSKRGTQKMGTKKGTQKEYPKGDAKREARKGCCNRVLGFGLSKRVLNKGYSRRGT